MDVADLRIDERLDPHLGALLAGLNSVTGKCRWALGDLQVSDEAVVWQPSPNGHSIGALLLHSAESEGYWFSEVAAGRPRPPEELQRLLADETRPFDLHWPAAPARPLAWYYEQQDLIRARTKEIVAELGDPKHVAADESDEHYTLRWLLAHVAWHESYHNGQAALLAMMFDQAAQSAK